MRNPRYNMPGEPCGPHIYSLIIALCKLWSYLTFEGGVDDFGKKYSASTCTNKKMHVPKVVQKKNILHNFNRRKYYKIIGSLGELIKSKKNNKTVFFSFTLQSFSWVMIQWLAKYMAKYI